MQQVIIDVKDNINNMEEYAIWDEKEREYFIKHIKPQLMKRLKEIK